MWQETLTKSQMWMGPSINNFKTCVMSALWEKVVGPLDDQRTGNPPKWPMVPEREVGHQRTVCETRVGGDGLYRLQFTGGCKGTEHGSVLGSINSGKL